MRALVVGIANLQTTLFVDEFPIDYRPVRYLSDQIVDSFGGVGFNQARRLAELGNVVAFAAPLGDDPAGRLILAELAALRIDSHLCTTDLARSPRSVILVDRSGQRQINTDLGDATSARFDLATIASEISDFDVAVLGNLDFSRGILPIATSAGCPTFVDLQAVSGPDNPYDTDFLAADVVAMSGERLGADPTDVVQAFRSRSDAELIVMTMGHRGALASSRGVDVISHIPAPDVGPVRDTTGAGDYFFATLAHHLIANREKAQRAIELTTVATAEHLHSLGQSSGTRPDG